MMDAMECWIFPLAPFVLAYYIVCNAIRSVWFDLVSQCDDLIEWNKDEKPSCPKNMSIEQWAQDKCTWKCVYPCPYE